jgi:hypothetical protein
LETLEWRLADKYEQTSGPFAILDVRGKFAAGSARREQRNEIDQLVVSLGGNPAMSVAVIEHSSAADPNRTIKSSDPQKRDTDFVLRVAQRL